MSCIVLIGGGIGCGKTTLINYLLKHETDLFRDSNENDCVPLKSEVFVKNKKDTVSKLFAVHFDNLCSIQEQEQLMKTLRGWRDFRVDLLMAAERLITSACGSENSIAGPLTERSFKLLEKLNSMSNVLSNNLSKVIILVEDNFYYRSMRYDWFQIARRTNLGFATIFLHCPLSIAVHRNSTRGYHIPEPKIKKMLSFMEFPDPVKYRWEKYSLLFDSSSELTTLALVDAVKVIEEATKHPAEMVISEQKIEAQRICSKSVVHQADKILRRIVSKKISNFKADNTEEDKLKVMVLNLVSIRQAILLDIKHGNVDLPQDLVEKIQHLGIESVLEAFEESLKTLFNMTIVEKSLQEVLNFNSLYIN